MNGQGNIGGDFLYDIPDTRFNGIYKISPKGIVYDCKLKRQVTIRYDRNGNACCTLRVNDDSRMKRKIYLSHLLGFTFLNYEKMGLDFITIGFQDGNSKNNRLDNLIVIHTLNDYFIDTPLPDVSDMFDLD